MRPSRSSSADRPGILASRHAALAPDIIRRQVVIGAAALSPDGSRVVYTRRTVVAGHYQTSLWLVPYTGGRPRRLTHGRWSDTAPAWSPDGGTVAFTSDRGDGRSRAGAPAALYLIRPDGGEAERVCAAEHGDVGAPVWSPDGRRIAFTAEAGPPRFWAGDPKRRTARVIRTVDWRSDDGEHDYHTHLFVVGARPGPARPAHTWRLRRRRAGVAPGRPPDRLRRPDRCGRRPRPQAEHPPGASGGGQAQAARGARGPRPAAGLVARRPQACVRRHRHPRARPDHAELDLYVCDGSTARSLTGALDVPVTLGWGSDLHDWMGPEQPPPCWDGPALLVPLNRRGRDEVWRVPLEGDPHPLTTGDTTLAALGVSVAT